MADQPKAIALAKWLTSDLPSDGHGMSLADAAAELIALQAANEQLQATVNEADRRAGAAERQLESERDTNQRRDSWMRTAKQEAGYGNNTSFDVVWAEALAALLEVRKQKGLTGPAA